MTCRDSDGSVGRQVSNQSHLVVLGSSSTFSPILAKAAAGSRALAVAALALGVATDDEDGVAEADPPALADALPAPLEDAVPAGSAAPQAVVTSAATTPAISSPTVGRVIVHPLPRTRAPQPAMAGL